MTKPIVFSFAGPFQSRGAGRLPASNFKVTLSAGEQSHPYAPAPKADRDRPADTAAGSRDESRSPVERGGHYVPPGVVGVVDH